MSSTNKWLKNIEIPTFFESYRNWKLYGFGTMLVHYDGVACIYVRFTNDHSGEREILNEGLLTQYLKEANDE